MDPFGAVCISTTRKHYTSNNILYLAIFDTTLKRMEETLNIHVMKYMPHEASAVSLMGSGTSDHVENLNPNAGKIPKKTMVLQEHLHHRKPHCDLATTVHSKNT